MPRKKAEPLDDAVEMEATAEPMEESEASVPETSAIDEPVVDETAIYELPPDESVPDESVSDESAFDEPAPAEPADDESIAPPNDEANDSDSDGAPWADDGSPFDADPTLPDTDDEDDGDFASQFTSAFFGEEPLRLDDAVFDEDTDDDSDYEADDEADDNYADDYADDEAESAEHDDVEPPPKPAPAPRPVKRKVSLAKETELPDDDDDESDAEDFAPPPEAQRTPRRPRAPKALPVLTIEARDEIESDADREAVIWHEIHNAYRTRRILTGMFGGVESLENGNTIGVVYYKEQRIVIPIKEMMFELPDILGVKLSAVIERQQRILGGMLGAEIDFVVRGIDSKQRSVVASRREAMLMKRRIFYAGTNSEGQPHIHVGRIVQARVIAVAEQAIRIEVFGVECSIRSGDLSWDWVGDARELYSIGDRILVKILEIKRHDDGSISIKVDVRSNTKDTSRDNLKKCRIQGKYAGKIIDVRKGVVFIRLSTGVNAIAHSCADRRSPGKRDDISFAVTHIDEERGVAVGIISRIIKQNL